MFRATRRKGVHALMVLVFASITAFTWAEEAEKDPEIPPPSVETEIKVESLTLGSTPMTALPDWTVKNFRIPAPRSRIVSADGVILAQNRVGKRLVLSLASLADSTDAAVSLVNGLRNRFDEKVPLLTITEEEVKKHYAHRPWIPLAISPTLPDEALAILGDYPPEGISIGSVYVREYPEGELTAHLVGNIGVALPDQHGPVGRIEYAFPPTEGRAGMETTLDAQIRGTEGEVLRLYDPAGDLKHQEVLSEAKAGNTLVLSINLGMQRLAREQLERSGRPGAFVAVVAVDADTGDTGDTGDILALVSHPTFDPNLFENRNQILHRMHQIGKLTDAQFASLLANETVVVRSREHLINRGQVNYLLARVERELRVSLATRPVPIKSLDGLVVETSIDLKMQQKAARVIDRHLEEIGKKAAAAGALTDDLEAAFVLMENRTGQIMVSVGSRDFHKSEYDRAIEMTRPPGSAIFPFVYAAAYEKGAYKPDSPVFDAPFDNREMGLGSIGGVLGEWSTENPGNRWEGRIPASEALRFSKNAPTARLGLQVGLGPLRELMVAAGIQSALDEAPGSILGSSEVNLTEITLAYTVFPNGGTRAPLPGMIREVRDASGKLISPPLELMPETAMSASSASTISESLTNADAGEKNSGKSGTTPAFTDAWYFGFDEDYTWGTWIGRDSFTPLFPLAFGGTLAKPLAAEIVAERAPVAAVVPVAASEKP